MTEEEQEAPAAPVENNEPPRRNLVADAEAAALKLAALNKELSEKLQRLEALQVERTLGGTASVNVPQREESPVEYAEKVLRGDIRGE